MMYFAVFCVIKALLKPAEIYLRKKWIFLRVFVSLLCSMVAGVVAL